METDKKTTIERTSDVELVVTRTVNAPAPLVFEAWTNPDLFRRWWVPKSYGLNLVSIAMDVRPGGEYRLTFLHEGTTMEFFGTYTEVTPPSRLVWTNESAGQTQITIHDLYPSPEAVETGATGAMPEVLDQLDDLLSLQGYLAEKVTS